MAWAADCAVAHSLTMQPWCVHRSLRSPVFLHFSLRCFSWSGRGVSAPEGVAGDREAAVPGEVRSGDQRLKEFAQRHGNLVKMVGEVLGDLHQFF